MSTAVLIASAGRTPYLRMCIYSLRRALLSPAAHACLVNCADFAIPASLVQQTASLGGDFELISLPRSGQQEGIRAAWEALKSKGATHVLYVEEDFLFRCSVDLESLVALLDDRRCLQVILPRQRCFQKEYVSPTWTAFLSSYFGGELTSAGDLLVPMFTLNPSVYEIDRLDAIAPKEASLRWGEFEQRIHDHVRAHGLYALIRAKDVDHVAVQHLGLVTSTKHRAIQERGAMFMYAYYAARHLRGLVQTCIAPPPGDLSGRP